MSALDTEYFRRKMELIIRDLSHYKPQEMARELVRLAKVADESETSKEAAQATPEGADLPEKLKTIIELYAESYRSMSKMGDGKVDAGNVEYDMTANIIPQIMKAARAALAATTAAEPVAWRWCPIQHFGYVLSDDKEVVERLRKVGQKIEPLYRAAPPQQVAPMTPEMLRAVQLRSEVGTYITANWANAYDCLQELWRVACEAQGKQVDTSGLPG